MRVIREDPDELAEWREETNTIKTHSDVEVSIKPVDGDWNTKGDWIVSQKGPKIRAFRKFKSFDEAAGYARGIYDAHGLEDFLAINERAGLA